MQLKNIAYKLQKALCCKGRYIRINQIQAFSIESQRMVTKYVVKERRYIEALDKEKDITLIETYKMIDVVNYLAEQLSGGE